MGKQTLVLAFSGGLDTSYCLVALRESSATVTTVTVDTGGMSRSELVEIRERAELLGADKHVVIDGRQRLYDEFVSYLLKANYLRNGIYPSCVGVERMLQAEEVARFAIGIDADALAHGSTGAGNDHVRFDAVTTSLAPEMSVLAPIRDRQITREVARDYLRERGFATSDITARYSFNHGIMGTSIGGGETYGSWEYLPDEAWPITNSIDQAPDEADELTICFENGLPVQYARSSSEGTLTPKAQPGHEILMALNELGGVHGIGRGIHMGQAIMGIQARLGFEAPGMTILMAAHRELERLVLTSRQQFHKVTMGAVLGDMLHEGVYYDPLLRDLRAFLDSSQERVSGLVRVRLHKANVVVLGCRSPFSLLAGTSRLGSTYGHGSSMWTGDEARAFARIYAMPGRVATEAGRPSEDPEASLDDDQGDV